MCKLTKYLIKRGGGTRPYETRQPAEQYAVVPIPPDKSIRKMRGQQWNDIGTLRGSFIFQIVLPRIIKSEHRRREYVKKIIYI